MKKRKITFRVINAAEESDIEGAREKVYELEGEARFRVFEIDTEGMAPARAYEYLRKVRADLKLVTKPIGIADDIFIPVGSNFPRVEVAVWEEVEDEGEVP